MKYEVVLNGKKYEVDVTETDAVITSVSNAPVQAPAAPAVQAPAPAAAHAPAAAAPAVSGENVIAPMPGNILDVKVSAGQSVKAGDVMFILEAMKMENEIVAPAAGTVKQILVQKGSVVNSDDVLAVI